MSRQHPDARGTPLVQLRSSGPNLQNGGQRSQTNTSETTRVIITIIIASTRELSLAVLEFQICDGCF